MNIWKSIKPMDEKEEGMSSFISMAFVILFISILLVGFLCIFGEVRVLEDIERIPRKYVILMERDGYLTDSNRAALQAELTAAGVTNIDLTGTSLTEVGYGNEFSLVIKGTVEVNELGFSAGSLGVVQKGTRSIHVEKTGVALY